MPAVAGWVGVAALPAALFGPALFGDSRRPEEGAGVSLSARAGEGRTMRPQARPRTNVLIKFLRDIEMKIFSDLSTIATP